MLACDAHFSRRNARTCLTRLALHRGCDRERRLPCVRFGRRGALEAERNATKGAATIARRSPYQRTTQALKNVVLQQRMMTFTSFSNEDLHAEAQRLATDERLATAALVRCLVEVETRRLYLEVGCASLFVYCTRVLHLCEGAAYNRIEAARAGRKFPTVLERLEDGCVTLTAVRLLAPHLTTANHQQVLAAAAHKTKREVELLVASLAPKPDAATVIRKLPNVPALPVPRRPAFCDISTSATGEPITETLSAVAPAPLARPAPAVVVPLTPERYKLQVTISDETEAKLRALQGLLRHTIPSGDPAEIIDRALTLLLEDVERRRCGSAKRRRADGVTDEHSRNVPAAVRRAVWKRDGGRCAFVGSGGRCTERAFLEYHHVVPFAAGGTATVDNIQLRCRAHNAYEADLFFGCDRVRERQPSWGDDSFRNEWPGIEHPMPQHAFSPVLLLETALTRRSSPAAACQPAGQWLRQSKNPWNAHRPSPATMIASPSISIPISTVLTHGSLATINK